MIIMTLKLNHYIFLPILMLNILIHNYNLLKVMYHLLKKLNLSISIKNES